MATSETLTPTVYNVNLTTADTQYSQALPANTRYFSVWCRDGSVMRLAFVTGKVATPTAPYLTIGANAAYNSPEKIQASPSGLTLYLASPDGSKVAEILAWVAE